MITERTLRKWRREALYHSSRTKDYMEIYSDKQGIAKVAIVAQERILRLTQELLDQHLLRKEVR